MPSSDDKRAELDGLNEGIRSDYQTLLAQHAASGRPNAHGWTVSITGVLDAVDSSGGKFVHHAPVVAHDDSRGGLATARRVVIRVAEPSLPLREEEVSQHGFTAYTGEEARRKQAGLEELTGRKLIDVLATSAALAAELGEGHAVITAPSPSTHDMPQNARDSGDQERTTNAKRHIETIRSIPKFAVNRPAITLLFDNPDPRIAERILAELAADPGLRDAVDEIVVVDGQRLETRRVTGKVVAFPADPLREFPLKDLALNQSLNRYGAEPRAERQPLIAVPEGIPVRCIAVDNANRLELIATALRTPTPGLAPAPENVSPSAAPVPAPLPPIPESPTPPTALGPRPPTTTSPHPTTATPSAESPLNPHQHRFLAELQRQGADYVVTGPTALRLHGYATGVPVPEGFTLAGFPGLDVALKPGGVGLTNLRAMVKQNLITLVGPPIPIGLPASGEASREFLLEPMQPDDPLWPVVQKLTPELLKSIRPDDAQQLLDFLRPMSPAEISYGTTGSNSYPMNRVDRHVAVGDLQVPVAPVREVAGTVWERIEAGMAANVTGPGGILREDELKRFVDALEAAAPPARPATPRGRLPYQQPGWQGVENPYRPRGNRPGSAIS